MMNRERLERGLRKMTLLTGMLGASAVMAVPKMDEMINEFGGERDPQVETTPQHNMIKGSDNHPMQSFSDEPTSK